MKKLLLILSGVLIGFASQAQNNEHIHKDHNWCGDIPQFERDVVDHPEFREQKDAFLRELKETIEANAANRTDFNQKVIIPCVFHIIHDEGSGNITKSQIESQIKILNDDYNRLNADTVNTPVPFRSVAGKLNVEFRLAQLDPAGNCTEGIVRVNSSKTNDASNQNGVKGLSYWNSYSYLNFWIVQSIGLSIEGGGQVLGYAQFPASGLLSTDGVVMRNNVTGNIGTAQGAKGRTATHEVGHWLSLIHIWGDAECGSDAVDDTPTHYQPNFSVCYNSFPYVYLQLNPGNPLDTLIYNPCNTDVNVGEMMVNYMDYSADQCQNMFSAGQVERMKAVLYGTEGTNGIRSYLWSEQNLWATGVHDDYVEVDCKPIADFVVNKKMVCTGRTVNFDDLSYNGAITTRNWTFTGGNPATSNSTSPNVSWDQAGNYEVSLEVVNSQGSDTEVKTSYVIVSEDGPTKPSSWAYWDPFGLPDDFYNDWIIINNDGENGWQHANFSNTPDNWGTVRMTSYEATPGEVDDLISPAFDLTTVSSPVLKFNYSGATRLELGTNNQFGVDNDGDGMRIFYSTNCGESWQVLSGGIIQNEALINTGLVSTFYTPWDGSIWTEKSINIPAGAANNDNVRFKFQFTSGGYGNNLYLDDFRIEGPTSVEELEGQFGMNLYPNPAEEMATLSFEMPTTDKVSMTLVDVTGRQVLTVYEGTLQQGDYNFNIELNNLDAGLYMLNVQYKDLNFAKKLIVN